MLRMIKYCFGEAKDLASYINTYVGKYPDRIGNLVPLIAFIETATERQGLLDAVEKVRNKLCFNNT